MFQRRKTILTSESINDILERLDESNVDSESRGSPESYKPDSKTTKKSKEPERTKKKSSDKSHIKTKSSRKSQASEKSKKSSPDDAESLTLPGVSTTNDATIEFSVSRTEKSEQKENRRGRPFLTLCNS